MTAFDGAVVTQVLPHGERRGCGVLAAWSGGLWSPESDESIRQFRGDLFLGIWEIDAIDVVGRREATVTWLRPAKREQTLESGDILVRGDGAYTVLPVAETELDASGWRPVEFTGDRYHALLNGSVPEPRLIVFHESSAAISRDQVQKIWYRGTPYTLTLSQPVPAGEPLLCLEASEDTVSINWLVKTLRPIRGFVLDAGQELLFRKQRPQGGRRLGETYTYFEPRLMPERGSLRLLIYSAEPTQIPLFVSPNEPLIRLGHVLASAAENDVETMTNQLSQDLFSTDDLLRRVREIAKAAISAGGVKVTTPQEPAGFQLDESAVESVSQGLQSLETRLLERIGTLYGLDTRRSWCRVAAESPNGAIEDWTLRFDDDLRHSVEGRIPREVRVEFSTQTRAGLVRGTGALLTVQNARSSRAES